MKKNLFILFVIILFGCSQNSDLTDSVYVADTDNPSLPAYTEAGYNTFGAVYERKAFTYTTDLVPLKITVTNDTLSFTLQGAVDYYDDLSIRFNLPNSSDINVYQDLLIYHDSVIDLIEDDISVEFLDSSWKIVTVLEGELKFKRVQQVFVDDEESHIILSGFFSLKFMDYDNNPSNMSNGRFDLGVRDNFYKLD